MERTQIYLTEDERKSIKIIAERQGQSQSEVIRTAVDRYLEEYKAGKRLELLRLAKGLWGEREDLPDFRALRRELDRF